MFMDEWDECAKTLKALLVITHIAAFFVGGFVFWAGCVFL